MGPEKTGGIRFGSLGERWIQCLRRHAAYVRRPHALADAVALPASAQRRSPGRGKAGAHDLHAVRTAGQRRGRAWNLAALLPTLGRYDSSSARPVDGRRLPSLPRQAPPAEMVDKRVYSPWMSRDLAQLLQRHGVDTLVVSGAETEVCVLSTVLGASTAAIGSSSGPTRSARRPIRRTMPC